MAEIEMLGIFTPDEARSGRGEALVQYETRHLTALFRSRGGGPLGGSRSGEVGPLHPRTDIATGPSSRRSRWAPARIDTSANRSLGRDRLGSNGGSLIVPIFADEIENPSSMDLVASGLLVGSGIDHRLVKRLVPIRLELRRDLCLVLGVFLRTLCDVAPDLSYDFRTVLRTSYPAAQPETPRVDWPSRSTR